METASPDLALFDRLRELVQQLPAIEAVEQLCQELRQTEDFESLFYALLMKKRLELGVSPFPTSPASELPTETHQPYEDAIRKAGNEVGQLYLERRQFSKAWGLYRMLGDAQPLQDALETLELTEDEDPYTIIEIAWQNAVHPKKGFDIMLKHHGICSSITMIGSVDLSAQPELREYCVKKLIIALHEQLMERLTNDFTSRGINIPAGATIPDILALDPEAFTEDLYHVDTSHLSSVVQFATQLSPGPELDLALELAAYGERLAPGLRGDENNATGNTYTDYKHYIQIVAGVNVEQGIQHFQDQAAKAYEMSDTYTAETLVNLLLRIDRPQEALSVAQKYLAGQEASELSCPPIVELARRAKDYAALAEAAKEQADLVNFVAGLIAAKQAS